MINFCLTIILLSALRKIMYQIDSDIVKALDDKLETAFFTVVGIVVFLKDIIKPTKTEIELYEVQKQIAVENFWLIINSTKSVIKAIYTRYICKANTKEFKILKLMPMTESETELNEEQSHAA